MSAMQMRGRGNNCAVGRCARGNGCDQMARMVHRQEMENGCRNAEECNTEKACVNMRCPGEMENAHISRGRTMRNDWMGNNRGGGCGNERENRGCPCGSEREGRGCPCGSERESRDCGCGSERESRACAGAAERNCAKDPAEKCPDPLYGVPLAMGYVPWQDWKKIYSAEEGLQCGTIFSELNLPFLGCIPKGWPNGRGGRR